MMTGMDNDALTRFDRSSAVLDTVLAGVKADQHADPTPCADWDIRALVNHVVTGNLVFQGILLGTPPIDRTVDHLGDDPLEAYRSTLAELRTAFLGEGVATTTYQGPIGPATGAFLLEMRTTECYVHAWDLARAAGQSTDLDPEIAVERLTSIQARGGLPRAPGFFGPEQPAPANATEADKLAAYFGRTL